MKLEEKREEIEVIINTSKTVILLSAYSDNDLMHGTSFDDHKVCGLNLNVANSCIAFCKDYEYNDISSTLRELIVEVEKEYDPNLKDNGLQTFCALFKNGRCVTRSVMACPPNGVSKFYGKDETDWVQKISRDMACGHLSHSANEFLKLNELYNLDDLA